MAEPPLSSGFRIAAIILRAMAVGGEVKRRFSDEDFLSAARPAAPATEKRLITVDKRLTAADERLCRMASGTFTSKRHEKRQAGSYKYGHSCVDIERVQAQPCGKAQLLGCGTGVWQECGARGTAGGPGYGGAPLLVKVAATTRHDCLDEAQLAPISTDCKSESHRVQDGKHLPR